MSIADKLIVIISLNLKLSTSKLDCHICSFSILINKAPSAFLIAIQDLIGGVIITFEKIIGLLNICNLNKGLT